MKPGKLIVIDGIDGAGKTTQAHLLAKTLPKAEYLHFPRYDTFYGKTVKRFLDGDFGTIEQTSPYLTTLAYALDRHGATDAIHDTLATGTCMVLDRYISSNLAHQGSRINNPQEQEKFIAWNTQLEYEELHTPSEALVLLLDTPPHIAAQLKQTRESLDILESDQHHQESTYELYLKLEKQFEHWKKIPCLNASGELRAIEAIHNDILDAIHEIL